MFKTIEWKGFLATLQGYDDQVMLWFSQGFDRHITHIGSLLMRLLEETMAHVTTLARIGEKWFKKYPLDHGSFNMFLKPTHQNEDWEKGVP